MLSANIHIGATKTTLLDKEKDMTMFCMFVYIEVYAAVWLCIILVGEIITIKDLLWIHYNFRG